MVSRLGEKYMGGEAGRKSMVGGRKWVIQFKKHTKYPKQVKKRTNSGRNG